MKNKLLLGDNLSIMQNMESESIDLIATDPPFNTGRDWGEFNDKWEGGLKGYLKFMEPRCVEMHRLLKPTGSFYLHCDQTASHYLKVMLDGIFGIKRFLNEIIWHYVRFGVSKVSFATNHNSILFYSKEKPQHINFSAIRVPVAQSTIERKKYPPGKNRKWIGNDTEWKNLSGFKNPNNVWNFPFLGSTAKERLGYPTQKPVALYERIIKASSNEGDLVLDPFCGSGTTLDAAQQLNRNYIGIDKNPRAIEITKDRLRQMTKGDKNFQDKSD